uniref:Uncharacterized protein n=1 Tax=Oryza punctata TaxID=4537 RepID=A0A0E0LUK7_ORYPU
MTSKLGVKYTSLRFGDSTKSWISGFGAACIANSAFSVYNADLGYWATTNELAHLSRKCEVSLTGGADPLLTEVKPVL